MNNQVPEIKKAKSEARQRRFLRNALFRRTKTSNTKRSKSQKPVDLTQLKKDRADQLERIRVQWLSRVRVADIDAQARNLVEDLGWISNNMKALINHPQHQATINGITFEYLPVTLRNLVELPDQHHEVAVESTLNAVTVMAKEVERIKAGIEGNRLDRLQSHAEAMRSLFSPQQGDK